MAAAATGQFGGMGWSNNFSGQAYGIFTGLCYLFPLFGGMLADRYLGERKSVLLGGILITIGYFICAIDNTLPPFIIGLSIVVIGTGFFKPTVLTMLGDLYEQGDKRRDSAFTIYYMLFNAGVFLAPIICGILRKNYGFSYVFLTAGTAMLISLIIYAITAKKYLGNIGLVPKRLKVAKVDEKKEPLTKDEKDRIAVIFVLLFFVTFFWTGFEQAGSSFNLYTETYVNRTLFGFEIPTEWFQSINPLLVVLLSPIFSWLWIALERKGKNPSTPVKMGLGMVILGVGFLFMLGAVYQRGGDIADPAVKASLFWLLATYFLHTVGELCLSPIGYSMITKLAPVKLASLFMGVWFLSNFLANTISGFMVGFIEKLGAGTIFGGIAAFVIVLGIIVFIIARKLVVLMHGRD
jgi:POT family proton-dependent oligopeptide transporter